MRMDPGVADHAKIDALCRDLSGPDYDGGRDPFRCWVRLLGYVADHKPDGILGDNATLIEFHAKWRGAPGAFIQTLLRLQLLDHDLYGYGIHKWKERQPWIAEREARSRAASYAASCRWNKAKSEPQEPLEPYQSPNRPTAGTVKPPEPPDSSNRSNRHTEKPQSTTPCAPSLPETKPRPPTCAPHTHAPTNQPTGNNGFTTPASPVIRQRPVENGGPTAIAGLVDDVLSKIRPRPRPDTVDFAWECWDAIAVVMLRFHFTPGETAAAIGWARDRYGPDPDGYTQRKLVHWAISTGRHCRLSKIAYFKSCRGDPNPPQDDEAKLEFELALSAVRRRRDRKPQEVRT